MLIMIMTVSKSDPISAFRKVGLCRPLFLEAHNSHCKSIQAHGVLGVLTFQKARLLYSLADCKPWLDCSWTSPTV